MSDETEAENGGSTESQDDERVGRLSRRFDNNVNTSDSASNAGSSGSADSESTAGSDSQPSQTDQDSSTSKTGSAGQTGSADSAGSTDSTDSTESAGSASSDSPPGQTDSAGSADSASSAGSSGSTGSSSQTDPTRTSIKDLYEAKYLYLPSDLKNHLDLAVDRADLDDRVQFADEPTRLEKNRHLHPLVIQLGIDALADMDAQQVRQSLRDHPSIADNF